jgi:hypothetical protein
MFPSSACDSQLTEEAVHCKPRGTAAAVPVSDYVCLVALLCQHACLPLCYRCPMMQLSVIAFSLCYQYNNTSLKIPI